jgi:hypothetical protein
MTETLDAAYARLSLVRETAARLQQLLARAGRDSLGPVEQARVLLAVDGIARELEGVTNNAADALAAADWAPAS